MEPEDRRQMMIAASMIGKPAEQFKPQLDDWFSSFVKIFYLRKEDIDAGFYLLIYDDEVEQKEQTNLYSFG